MARGLVEIEYHSLPDMFAMSMLTWPYLVNLKYDVFNTPNIPPLQTTLSPCLMNGTLLTHCQIHA